MIVNEGGGGGKKLPTLTSPASASQILTGRQAIDQNGEILAGTMPNRGAVTQSLNAGGSYTIPAGYHNGTGRVNANSLASQTSATAVAADIKSGKTAWVNGAKITGSGNIREDTTFGFLCHGLYDRIRVYTDLAVSDPNNDRPGREYYTLEEGDSSAHTFMCTIGSYVIVMFYNGDRDRIGNSGLVGFDNVTYLSDDRGREIRLYRCVEAEGSMNVESR